MLPKQYEEPPEASEDEPLDKPMEEEPLKESTEKSCQRSYKRTYPRKRSTQISYLMHVVDLSLLTLQSRVALARGNLDPQSGTSSGHDPIWVISDRMTKSTYFLAIRKDYKMEKLARLYIDEVVARRGVPESRISNHDSRFTS
ncbi:putative reverse transcriptase domain-containing protein [Tanacetum coccineum]